MRCSRAERHRADALRRCAAGEQLYRPRARIHVRGERDLHRQCRAERQPARRVPGLQEQRQCADRQRRHRCRQCLSGGIRGKPQWRGRRLRRQCPGTAEHRRSTRRTRRGECDHDHVHDQRRVDTGRQSDRGNHRGGGRRRRRRQCCDQCELRARRWRRWGRRILPDLHDCRPDRERNGDHGRRRRR